MIRLAAQGDSRNWQQLWPLPEPNLSLTPLQTCILWRKLKTFIGAALSLLADVTHDTDEYGDLMVSLLRTRILPEIAALQEEEAAEIRSRLIQVVLELLSIHDSEDREYLLMHFCDWYQQKGAWRDGVEAALTEIVGALQHLTYVGSLGIADIPIRMGLDTAHYPTAHSDSSFRPATANNLVRSPTHQQGNSNTRP